MWCWGLRRQRGGGVGEVRVPVVGCGGRFIMQGREELSGDDIVEVMKGRGKAISKVLHIEDREVDSYILHATNKHFSPS
jgi:hypothetical protein